MIAYLSNFRNLSKVIQKHYQNEIFMELAGDLKLASETSETSQNSQNIKKPAGLI